MITCKELIEFLYDYVAEDLPDDRRADFEEHLAVCPSCVNYIQSYKSVIRLGKIAMTTPDAEAPADVPEDLIRAILRARKPG